jgi:hypothetical protein
MTADQERGSVICPQCGTWAAGNYCARCRTSLDPAKESVSAEVRSTATTPLVTLLSGLWRRVSPGLQKVTPPFRCLASAIALIALIGVLQDGVWRVTGFSERVFGMSSSDLGARQWAELERFYEREYGQRLTKIETAHVTGIGLVDQPVRQVFELLQYMYFPLVVSLFLVDRAVRRHALVHFYVYAVCASLMVLFVLNLVGLAVFVLLAGVSPDAALGLSGLPVLVGGLAKIYFLVVFPVVLLPSLMQVTRRRVLLATLTGAVVWMAINWVMTRILLFGLGVVFV